jgi:hypothetical protein
VINGGRGHREGVGGVNVLPPPPPVAPPRHLVLAVRSHARTHLLHLPRAASVYEDCLSRTCVPDALETGDPSTPSASHRLLRSFSLVENGPLAWAGTKGPVTSPQNRNAAHEALVPARNEPLVPV